MTSPSSSFQASMQGEGERERKKKKRFASVMLTHLVSDSICTRRRSCPSSSSTPTPKTSFAATRASPPRLPPTHALPILSFVLFPCTNDEHFFLNSDTVATRAFEPRDPVLLQRNFLRCHAARVYLQRGNPRGTSPFITLQQLNNSVYAVECRGTTATVTQDGTLTSPK